MSTSPTFSEATGDVVQAYLVPTPAGTWHAVATDEPDSQRQVLWGLLRGAASRPVPLAKLVEWTGLPDRKAIRTLLFKMQREGWLSGDVEPLALPSGPLAQSLTELLTMFSDCGRSLLGNDDGLCMAVAGFEHAEAERLAALSAGLYPLYRQHRRHGNDAGTILSWTLSDDEGGAVAVRSLHLGGRVFHLVVGGVPVWNAEAIVPCAALLSRRYLGEC
jgi:hypothetical protein